MHAAWLLVSWFTLLMDPNVSLVPESMPMRPYAEAVQRAAKLTERGRYESALHEIEHVHAPAADLVRARAYRGLGKWEQSEQALRQVRTIPWMLPMWQLEDGLLATAQNDIVRAQTRLLPLVVDGAEGAGQAALALLPAMAAHDPNALLLRADAFRAVLPANDATST